MEAKISANSADSHLVEPPGLWNDLHAPLRERIRFGAFQDLFPHVPDPPTA